MSFYVTLHGTTCTVKSELDPPLHLTSDYQVSLTDISFNSNLLVNYGCIILSHDDNIFKNNRIEITVNSDYGCVIPEADSKQIQLQIILEDNMPIDKFVQQVNDMILTEIYYTENPRLNNAYSEFEKVSKKDFVLKHVHNLLKPNIFYLKNNQMFVPCFVNALNNCQFPNVLYKCLF